MDSAKSNLLEKLFDVSSDAQLVLHKGLIRYSNSNAIKLFNQKSTVLANKSPFDFSPEYQPNGGKSKIMGKNFLNEAEVTGSARFEWLHASGNKLIWTEYILDKIKIDNQDYILAIIREIDDFKSQHQKTNERIERLISHNQALTELAASESSSVFSIESFNKTLARIAADTLIVDSVSIWYIKNSLVAECKECYHKGRYSIKKGMKINLEDYPRLAIAIKERQPVVTSDAFKDPRTNDLVRVLHRNKTRKHSMIIVPLINNGIIQGMVWIEKEGETRKWEYEEQSFAVSLGEMIAKQLGTVQKLIAEQKLEKSEKIFKALIEHSHDVVCIIDSDGLLKYQSPSFKKTLGYEKNELIGKRSIDLVHPDDVADLKNRFRKLLTQPNSEDTFTYRVKHKNGNWIHIEALARNLLNDREIGGVVINFRDISAKKNAESALIESQLRLEGIISSALDAIITIDSNHNVVLFNSAAEHMFNYPASEIFGQPVEMLFPIKLRKKYKKMINDFSKLSAINSFKINTDPEKELVQGMKSDGTLFPIDASISKQEIEGEIFFTAIVRNITEQIKSEQVIKEYSKTLEYEVSERTNQLNKKNQELNDILEDLRNTQEQLVESEKMASLGQLTAGIAHEINNPINFVSSTISPLKRDFEEIQELIGRKYDGNTANNKIQTDKDEVLFLISEISSLLDGIEEGAKRTKNIVLGLRKFSRLDEGTFKNVDLHEGLDSTLMLLKSKLHGKIEIVKKYNQIPLVECLPGKINQVFMNILSNAIQAIEGGGKITIKTRHKNAIVNISITDTGAGMSNEIKKRIFEPFFTTKEVGSGTGLGLSISYGIVENHGVHINVTSTPGHGASFVISLPVSHL